MEQNEALYKPFEQIFYFTEIKHSTIGIPFITKNVPIINTLISKLDIKEKYTKLGNTSLTFFNRLNEQPPFFSKIYTKYIQQRKHRITKTHLRPLSGHVCDFFIRVTISSIKYAKNTDTDVIPLHVNNNSPNKITLPLGLSANCETNAPLYPTQEKVFRVNSILKLLDICQSAISN